MLPWLLDFFFLFLQSSGVNSYFPFPAEKVTGNLTKLTGQVAPCDVSSVRAIRKAMGIAPPPEPLIDLTTGN